MSMSFWNVLKTGESDMPYKGEGDAVQWGLWAMVIYLSISILFFFEHRQLKNQPW